MSTFNLSRTPLPALLLDLEQVAASMRRYHEQGNETAAQQAWQDARGVVQEITARFELSDFFTLTAALTSESN